MSWGVALGLLVVATICLLYASHIEGFVSGYGLNWGVGSHAARYGSVAAGGLFENDASHGGDGAGALLDSYGF